MLCAVGECLQLYKGIADEKESVEGQSDSVQPLILPESYFDPADDHQHISCGRGKYEAVEIGIPTALRNDLMQAGAVATTGVK